MEALLYLLMLLSFFTQFVVSASLETQNLHYVNCRACDMKANVGKKIKITLQSVTLQKMLISVKVNLESLIVREDAWFFLSRLKSSYFIFTYM